MLEKGTAETREQIEALSTYEARLDSNLRWALSQGGMFFEGKGAVPESLERVTTRLKELSIPYAVCGGMALFAHGFRRFTEDVNLLVTADGLRRVHEALDGLGYVPPFAGSKQLRDAKTRVRIEFFVTGQFPGDGKPKDVAFPDPIDVAVEMDGIQYLSLVSLVTLKLASGMSLITRGKDIADVMEVIRILKLPQSIADQLPNLVRGKYLELWQALADAPAQEE